MTRTTDDSDGFRCARCGEEGKQPLGQAPMPGEQGLRVANEVCKDCWEAWKKHQMALINHYALNLRDPQARRFLMANLEAFLFGGSVDASAGEDTSTA